MKIVILYPSLKTVGGAQNVLIDLYAGLQGYFNVFISTYDKYQDINEKYKSLISRDHFFTYSAIKLIFGKFVIISHHRRMTTHLMLLSFGLKIIIHVAHGELFTLKRKTILSKNIIAVSERVKLNLESYLGVSAKNITVINNGIRDSYISNKENKIKDKINILYPGTIRKVKNQISLVGNLKGKISNKIIINFAGDGPELTPLKENAMGLDNFKVLGYRSDILELMNESDYILLFSKKEGLPITLLEAAMLGKPIICNDVGGNLDIVKDGYNGFVCDSYEELIQCLNNLVNISENDYKRMCSNSRKTYEEKFRYEDMIEKYVSYINRYLEKK